jgi:hypothetical protein
LPRPLYRQGKRGWYPLDRSLGGPQSRSGHGGEEKNSQPPPGLELPSSSPQSSAIPLSYPGSEMEKNASLRILTLHSSSKAVHEGTRTRQNQRKYFTLLRSDSTCLPFKYHHLQLSVHFPLNISFGLSSVAIALGYGLDDRGSRVRFRVGAGNFTLHRRVQNGSGAHPASYLMGTTGSLPGGKATGA